MNAVIAGDDKDDLGAALEAEGFEVARIEGFADRDALEAAEIDSADVFVITDTTHATAIPVARELNGSVRIVVYAEDSLPEFAQPLADLIVDPDLLGPDVIAEEL
jgi:Trk K+ transport system NAD-binding subunit